MGNYFSPGVYNENADTPSVNTEVAIGVAGMVGITQRGPINKAVRINSWNQYINNFALGMDSPFIAGSNLAYAVYGFFQNGGGELVVVRAAHSTAVQATASVSEPITAVIKAIDAGSWGNSLKVSIAANEDVGTNFDVTVKLSDSVVEVIKNVSNTSTDENYWVNRVNTESSYIVGTSGNLGVTSTDIAFTGGVDGVSDITDTDYVTAMDAMDAYTDIAYMAVPGVTTSTVQAGLKNYCTPESNIVPVFEAPSTGTVSSVRTLRKTLENDTGVIVWPWGYVTDPLSKAPSPNNVRLCPPSGHYMGVMSRVAQKRGIWKAPAGIEAQVKGFVKLTYNCTKDDLDTLNPVGVVSIIPVTNYGICVWGARTLNSIDPNFRYVSDLTLDAYIKRSTYVMGLPFVFEPNNDSTWVSIQSTIAAFMNNLMVQGAFKSSVVANAYYVKCDADLNDIHVQKNDGIIETEIGYAGAKPGEFIVFRIKHSISN